MMLKYVGEDGKNWLRKGNVYDCLLYSEMKYGSFDDIGIVVETKFPNLSPGLHYKTLKEMLEEWQEV